MKKILFPLAAVLCLIGFVTVGCVPSFGVGIGPKVTKEYDFKDFNDVEVSHAFEFEIGQSNTFNVVASVHENIVDHLDIYQSGKTLIVRLKPWTFNYSGAKATITMPEIRRLTLSGASRGKVKGFNSSQNFDLHVSGASQLDLDMQTGETSVDISGASKVQGNLKALETRLIVSGASRCDLIGSAGSTDIEVSGASQVDSPEFWLQDASVNLSGASRATIQTSGTLNLDVTGASTLNYSGNPTLSKVNVSGASKINSR